MILCNSSFIQISPQTTGTIHKFQKSIDSKTMISVYDFFFLQKPTFRNCCEMIAYFKIIHNHNEYPDAPSFYKKTRFDWWKNSSKFGIRQWEFVKPCGEQYIKTKNSNTLDFCGHLPDSSFPNHKPDPCYRYYCPGYHVFCSN